MDKIKSGIVLFLIFLIPFSFFPFFQNLVQINIVYVLAFGALLLVIISFLQSLISKKFVFQTGPLDIPVIIFLGAIFLSFFTSATNKMQAFLDPNFGLLMMISLGVLYFFVSRNVGVGFPDPLIKKLIYRAGKPRPYNITKQTFPVLRTNGYKIISRLRIDISFETNILTDFPHTVIINQSH